MQFRLGIIGATGYIGTPYRSEIRSSSQDSQIVSLCARRMDKLQEAAKADSAKHFTPDWHQVVEHPEVNTVLVLTPDAFHREPVIAAAELGKHIFCEKPVALNSVHALEMWTKVQNAGVAHFVPFWTRYVPSFVRLRELVEQEFLGEIHTFVYRWHNPRPISMPFTWRDDATKSAAGSLADVGSHAYDALRFVLNDEAQRVWAQTVSVMPPKPDLGDINLEEALKLGDSTQVDHSHTSAATAPDYAQVCIEFESGIRGVMILSHAGYVRKGFAPELELHGSKASVSINRINGKMLIADSPDPARPHEMWAESGDTNRFEEHVFPSFLDQIDGKTNSHPGLDDGLHVQIFTDAAAASAQRREWVDLTEFRV